MREILKLRREGKTYSQLAKITGVSSTTIFNRLKAWCEDNNEEYPIFKTGKKPKKIEIKSIDF